MTASKVLLTLFVVHALATPAMSLSPWEKGSLQVSQNGRYLQHANGEPFFWLGDTCWLLVQKLNREQVKSYFEDRQAKGFNVVQTVVFQMLNDKNAYGDNAIIDGDITRLRITPGSDPADSAQYDYWDHVDYAIDVAADHGIYLAIAPTWSHTVRRAPVTKDQAEAYVAVVAERWKHKPNVIWINGGSARGNENADVWEAIAATIKRIAPDQLMTFHTFGRAQSSTWFQNASWLDFNMFTSGHRSYAQDADGKGEDNWRYVLEDLAKTPRKPTLDGEPSYEATPQGLHDPQQPYWTANDVRRYAYWSIFAGACGHTYGHNSVRQVYLPTDRSPASGAREHFDQALNAPGAFQMRHAKNLILSRPYFDRVNDQAAVVDEGEKHDRVLVCRGRDFLMAYIHTGREFQLHLGRISGGEVVAWWFNPQTGEATKLGTFKNQGTKTFRPPGDKAGGNDWVLVLDDASKRFNAPGVVPGR
jgi:hypothetical protein